MKFDGTLGDPKAENFKKFFQKQQKNPGELLRFATKTAKKFKSRRRETIEIADYKLNSKL
jgi:hypothetical protein